MKEQTTTSLEVDSPAGDAVRTTRHVRPDAGGPSFRNEDVELLRELMEINTVTPMETGQPSRLREAQQRYLEAAQDIGFVPVHFDAPPLATLQGPAVPLNVVERAREMGSAFTENQPNLLLRLGRTRPMRQTLVLNFHMDTVSGGSSVRCKDGRLYGPGAVDNKGPGVAILAAARAALEQDPDLARKISVVIQSVGGEEGGAMGVYGTRHVSHIGPAGYLNIVCEPTRFRTFDRTTSSMTLRVEAAGNGSTDDSPHTGENATILLSHVTTHLVRALADPIASLDAKMCVGGIWTGNMHNRVYGTGCLHINFAYPATETAGCIEQLVDTAFEDALSSLEQEYASLGITRETARNARRICRRIWVKKSIPVLNNRHAELERVLADAGVERHGETSSDAPFTCDAMWLQNKGAYTIVLGPGDLSENHAHTNEEYVDIADLDRFTRQLTGIMTTFARWSDAPSRPVLVGEPQAATDSHRVFVGESLHHFYVSLFKRLGFSPRDAQIGADGVYYSDLHGIDSHGAVNLANIYVPMIESGRINIAGKPKVERSGGPCALLDGVGGLGYVVAWEGMEEAITRAETHGIGCVSVHNSNHAGSFGFYCRNATRRGLIALAMTNLGSQALLTPPGGKTPMVGTNVIAAAAPSGDSQDFSLDMSTAVVSSGRIKQCARSGQHVPAGWLIDGDGNSVTDPARYISGEATLNFVGGEVAGYKGFGLGLLADVLCGALSGASFGPGADRSEAREDHNVGHFFLVIDPQRFVGTEPFSTSMEKMLSAVRNSPARKADGEVHYPGSPEHEKAKVRAKRGIPIEQAVAEKLFEAAVKYRVECPKQITEVN